ncbi:MAG: hypothetical protein WEA09_10340 [Gemmatimonadota bacterium]
MRSGVPLALALAGALLFAGPPCLPAQVTGESPQERLQEAARSETRGDWSQASVLYREILGQDLFSRAALEGISRVALLQGDPDLALPFVESVIQAREEAVYPRVLRFRLLLARDGGGAVLEEWAEMLDRLGPQPEVRNAGLEAAAMLGREGREELARELLAPLPGWEARMMEAHLFLAQGEVEGMKEGLRRALPALPPDPATEALALLRLADAATPRGLELAARLILEEGVGGMEAVAQGWVELDQREAPALLLLAAGMAWARSEEDLGMDLLSLVISQFPRSPEAPEAALRWARGPLPATSREREERMAILEGVLVRHPASAVAPLLRRELNRLREMGS